MTRKLVRRDPRKAAERIADRFSESMTILAGVERDDADSADKTAPSLRDAKPASILPFE